MFVTGSHWSRKRFAAGISAAGAALFGTPLVASAENVLRFLFNVPASDPTAIEGTKFTKAVEQKSKGACRFDLFYNGELSKADAMITSLQTGVVDATLISTPFLDGKFMRLQVLSLPFIFPSFAGMWKVLDGDIGRSLNDELAQNGLVALAWGSYGARQFELREKRVTKPDDLKGLRLRVISSPIFTSMARALGSNPVAIDPTEVLVALQQKTIDGIDLPLASAISTKFITQCKYVALTDHGMNSALLVAGKKKIDSLPADQRKDIVDAASEMVPGWRTDVVAWDRTAVQDAQKQGVTVDQVDKAAFQRAMAPVYAEFKQRLGADLVDRVLKSAAS